MTYPEPRYLGDGGEPSATYRPAGHEPELVYSTGNAVHYLATGASTDGLFGLYRLEMGPQPSGPGPHFHRSIAESLRSSRSAASRAMRSSPRSTSATTTSGPERWPAA